MFFYYSQHYDYNANDKYHGYYYDYFKNHDDDYHHYYCN
jgi:hypothetical protein